MNYPNLQFTTTIMQGIIIAEVEDMEEKDAKEFMEKNFHNSEWWASGDYADDPNKKPSKQHLDQLERIKNRAKEAGVKLS